MTHATFRMTPRARILELARSIGEADVAKWCAGLLDASIEFDDPRYPSLTWLGGRHAESLLLIRELGANDYWPRVWGARGLMYVWHPDAQGAVVQGLADPAWRVREMSAKVVKRRDIADADALLAALASDPVPRVRAAALQNPR